LGLGERCRSSAFGDGAGLNNPVTACLAVALAKAGAETMPKPQKTAFFIYFTEWLQHFLYRSKRIREHFLA
jgi:hypothetical protein